MIIVDTSALFALLRERDDSGAAIRAVLEDEEVRVVSPFVLAELDYLVAKRFGVSAEIQALEVLSSGAFDHATLGAADVVACCAVIDRYRDLNVGLTDASLVVLAARYGTDRVCTLDRRHFQVLRMLDGRPFTVLP